MGKSRTNSLPRFAVFAGDLCGSRREGTRVGGPSDPLNHSPFDRYPELVDALIGEAMSGTQQDALDVAVNALAALVRMGADFKTSPLPKSPSRKSRHGSRVPDLRVTPEDLDLELLVGTVEMQFVISQPEAKRLDGRTPTTFLAQKKSQIFTKHGFGTTTGACSRLASPKYRNDSMK